MIWHMKRNSRGCANPPINKMPNWPKNITINYINLLFNELKEKHPIMYETITYKLFFLFLGTDSSINLWFNELKRKKIRLYTRPGGIMQKYTLSVNYLLFIFVKKKKQEDYIDDTDLDTSVTLPLLVPYTITWLTRQSKETIPRGSNWPEP